MLQIWGQNRNTFQGNPALYHLSTSRAVAPFSLSSLGTPSLPASLRQEEDRCLPGGAEAAPPPCRKPHRVRPGCQPRNPPPNNPAAEFHRWTAAGVRNIRSAAKS